MTGLFASCSVTRCRLFVLCRVLLVAALFSGLLAGLLSGLSWAGLVFSSDTSERRVKISLSIFPQIVVVDNDFKSKVTDENIVSLAFIYDRDRARAADLRKLFLKKSRTVAGMKLAVEAVAANSLSDDSIDSFTGLFVTERINDALFAALVDYAIRHQLILFSPFSGDVERGASAGISVTSRVKPFFNINTLERSNIEINSVLMDMSKHHE